MLLDKLFEFVGRTTVGQRTASCHIGYQHFLFRTEHLGRLTHEMNTAHHNDVGRRLGGLLGQSQTVADIVGDFLYFTALIIVTHDQGIFLFLQLLDGLYQIFHNR